MSAIHAAPEPGGNPVTTGDVTAPVAAAITAWCERELHVRTREYAEAAAELASTTSGSADEDADPLTAEDVARIEELVQAARACLHRWTTHHVLATQDRVRLAVHARAAAAGRAVSYCDPQVLDDIRTWCDQAEHLSGFPARHCAGDDSAALFCAGSEKFGPTRGGER